MGLYVTIWQLQYSSGIAEKVIRRDIKSKLLKVKEYDGETLVYYLDAIQYCYLKWNEGKEKMYSPHREKGPIHSFGESLLNKLDDGLSPAQLKMMPRLDKEGRALK